jgi:hypothetical protein
MSSLGIMGLMQSSATQLEREVRAGDIPVSFIEAFLSLVWERLQFLLCGLSFHLNLIDNQCPAAAVYCHNLLPPLWSTIISELSKRLI